MDKQLTVAIRPVILTDHQIQFFIAMELKVFDGYILDAHKRYEGFSQYTLVQDDSDIARLAGMSVDEYKCIGLKTGRTDEHGLLIFDTRKAANELACILWSKQRPPITIQLKPGQILLQELHLERKRVDEAYNKFIKKQAKEEAAAKENAEKRIVASFLFLCLLGGVKI